MSANGNWLGTPKGMKFVNIAYCVGAALVIVGALMKLMHWPGWDTFLPIGMGAEALLFLLGAFDEPHHEGSKWDWSSIYPNIKKEISPAEMLQMTKDAKKNGVELEEDSTLNSQSATLSASLAPEPIAQTAPVAQQNVQPVVSSANNIQHNSAPMAGVPTAVGLGKKDMEKWNESISKISETADNINKLSEIGQVSESYLSKLDAAGNAVESLAKVQVNSAGIIEESSIALASSYKKAGESLVDADSKLLNSYGEVSEALTSHTQVFKSSNDKTAKGIADVTKNLTSINSVYELQLNLVNDELKAKEAQTQAQISINDQLTLIQNAIVASAASNQVYAAESKKLETNISELNAIYGNMLSSLK